MEVCPAVKARRTMCNICNNLWPHMLAPGVDEKMGDGQERKVLFLAAFWEPLQRDWPVEMSIGDSSKHKMHVFCMALGRARSRQGSSRRRAGPQSIVFCNILGATKVSWSIRRSKSVAKNRLRGRRWSFCFSKMARPGPCNHGV